MTPLQRSLAGQILRFDLESEKRIVRSELAGEHSRIARTLVKEGPLRLTIIGVMPGGGLREHSADGPITIHVLEGSITLHVAGEAHDLNAGALMAVDAGVRHEVSSVHGGIFLLTLVSVRATPG